MGITVSAPAGMVHSFFTSSWKGERANKSYAFPYIPTDGENHVVAVR